MSLIWKHGYEAPPKVPRGHPSWLCNICGQRYSLKSTKHAWDHLRETHDIEEEGGQSKLTTLHSSRQITTRSVERGRQLRCKRISGHADDAHLMKVNAFGIGHINTAVPINHLGNIYAGQGKHDEAMSQCQH